MTFKAVLLSRLLKPVSLLAALAPVLIASTASAVTIIATPGEQNTQSGENGCNAAPCTAGHWLHYPEILKATLGAGYMVMQNGDGGAVLGCDAASKTLAGGNSFCASTKYTDSIVGPPNIAIIGPFGEHDQRVISGANAGDKTTFYTVAAFQAAYEGLVQDYLKLNAKVIMMTPIDVPFNAGALGAGQNIVKDVMLQAAKNVAQAHPADVKLVDTYTAITAAMYPVTDGQVNAAGQQKMADLLIAAIMTNGTGGSGGAGGAGGTGGAGGAAGSGGAGGAGGASAGAGGTATGGVAGTATGGVAGSTAVAGSTSTAGTSSVGGTSSGAGGTGPTGASGTASAGTGTAGAAPVTVTTIADPGGCSLSSANGAGWGAGLAMLGLALGALARKRRQ